MKKRFKLVLSAMLLLLVSSCGSNEPLRIGIVASLTGRYSDLGVQMRSGARLAMEEINASGGVHGRRIELVILDDESSMDVTDQAFQTMAEENVDAVLGPVTSNQAMAAWKSIEAFGRPVVSPTVSTPTVAGRKDNFFRVIPTNQDWALRLSSYALTQKGLRTVVFVGDTLNADYVKTFENAFARFFVEGGGRVLARLEFASGKSVDWSGIIRSIEELSPDGVVIAASARDMGNLAQRVRLAGQQVLLLGPGWPATEESLQMGGHAMEGAVFAVSHAERPDYTPYTVFCSRFEKRFGFAPNFAGVYAYEAMQAVALGLGKGKDVSTFAQALTDAGELPGVYGPYRFDAFGDVVRETHILVVRGGHFVIEP
ncbi:MAG: ABC transporter substrate-binding protein [Desulfovibrionaceae bacterium]